MEDAFSLRVVLTVTMKDLSLLMSGHSGTILCTVLYRVG